MVISKFDIVFPHLKSINGGHIVSYLINSKDSQQLQYFYVYIYDMYLLVLRMSLCFLRLLEKNE